MAENFKLTWDFTDPKSIFRQKSIQKMLDPEKERNIIFAKFIRTCP